MTPESYGISSKKILEYVKKLNDCGLAMHSMMMSVDGNVFYEAYWHPFNENTLQRMNSVSKSFVGIAIGLLEQEGKLSLTDKLYSFFPEINPDSMPDYIKEVTIYDSLTMQTASSDGPHWVKNKLHNRIERYFTENVTHISGTIFNYDSCGSYILGVIAERLCKKPFLDYLKEKALLKIGFSKESDYVKTPEGYSWGDSGVLCTLRDLHSFGQLVANEGMYKGERLINERFMKDAVSKHADTNKSGWPSFRTLGYGYQIWKFYDDGFAFSGMGNQFVFYIPDKKFMFVCTADNQGNEFSRYFIVDFLYNNIIREISDTPLPEDKEAYNNLIEYSSSMELVHCDGMKNTEYTAEINEKEYILDNNPMGIKSIKFKFENDKGYMEYVNKQGHKVLEFGLCKNVYTLFPEEDWPDMTIGEKCDGNKYPCAVSASWLEEKKLVIRVQSIGKHLGGLIITVSFKDNRICIEMRKNTNCFFNEYDGFANGVLK